MSLTWKGRAGLRITWEGAGPMYVHRIPVYLHTPQTLNYQFLDQDGTPIDLSAYDTISLEVKNQGELYDTLEATVVDAPAGRVTASCTFDEVGVWSLQFLALAISGDRVYGEIARLTACPNVEDLALDQLPNY